MSQSYSLKDVKEYTKELEVLYVEDEAEIRLKVLEILKLFFKSVHTAENGEEGLAQLQKHRADLLITDIQMPKMNGLDMVEQARKHYPELPVIITTAFSDQAYFLRSIELKVDRYLIKPIAHQRVSEVLFDIAKMIDDRRKAKELEVRKMQEKLNRMSEHMVSQITDSYQYPCIVYTDGKLRYLNDAFCALFDEKEIKSFLEGSVQPVSLFDQRDGYMWVLEEYNETDPGANRVSISRRKGRKIYRVMRQSVTLDGTGDIESQIYFFNDITLEEYQKMKIKTYTSMLEEMVVDARYRTPRQEHVSEPLPVAVEERAVERQAPPVKEVPIAPAEEAPAGPVGEAPVAPAGPKLVIDEMENELLRRSHLHKTTASEYIAELDNEILQELQELDELDNEFHDSIIVFKEDADIEGVRQMSEQLNKYAHEISLLFEFGDLAYALRSLSQLLASVEASKLDEKRMHRIAVLLEGIKSDLVAWRHVIFVEQEALDIHYLDSSMFSACLQIELALSDEVKEMESDEDDLILF